MIHSNHEVKPHWARLVLPWGTRWEARVTNVLSSFPSLAPEKISLSMLAFTPGAR